MAFEKLPGDKGLIYVPDPKPGAKKKPCADCFSCQWCADERCRICRAKGCCQWKKNNNSATEQEDP